MDAVGSAIGLAVTCRVCLEDAPPPSFLLSLLGQCMMAGDRLAIWTGRSIRFCASARNTRFAASSKVAHPVKWAQGPPLTPVRMGGWGTKGRSWRPPVSSSSLPSPSRCTEQHLNAPVSLVRFCEKFPWKSQHVRRMRRLGPPLWFCQAEGGRRKPPSRGCLRKSNDFPPRCRIAEAPRRAALASLDCRSSDGVRSSHGTDDMPSQEGGRGGVDGENSPSRRNIVSRVFTSSVPPPPPPAGCVLCSPRSPHWRMGRESELCRFPADRDWAGDARALHTM
ncbi:hypothetical protein LX32DRAFT_633974 [Colletotrichum zoysiae]|uniref:Uncharacterized protein n=1 Tax=Colletotrichum zoysiae TaxID=1216348 RepID=A0AAD9HT70_9PEZI|nr:hypothetical protein LX32DRAFT_633974 [Colletotrichum zoysiae]